MLAIPLVPDSTVFSKCSLNIWKFLVHVLLKPGLENFANVKWEQFCSSLNVLWHWLSLGLKWKHLFQSCGHCWVFRISWHVERSTFTALSCRIWHSSVGIPSTPLALFAVMLPKTHLTSHSKMTSLGEWPHHYGYVGHLRGFFCIVLLCILAPSS